MKRKIIGTIAVFAMAPLLVFGQGRSKAGGQRGQQGGGQAQTQGRGQGQTRQGTAQGQMDRGRMRQQLKTHATAQQRDQFRTCTQDMDRLRTQSRTMVSATGKGFNAENARQQRGRLHDQFQAMQQAHERFMNGLDKDQQQGIQSRSRMMTQLQSRISTRLQQMNQELTSGKPNQKRLQDQARSIDREMQRWQKEYRAMGEDLNVRTQ